MADHTWSRLLKSLREASLDGLSWHAAIRNVGVAFDSPGVAFYGQSTSAASFKETGIVGIGDSFIEAYRNHYSKRDNPWLAASAFWEPGKIRTEHALQELSGDRRVLLDSGYYCDWIRPQGFRHSMSVVVDRDKEGFLKLTLYRASEQRGYDAHDEARFAELCREIHLLLDLAPRYQMAASLFDMSMQALDCLDFGVLLLDERDEVLELNRMARSLLEDGLGLALVQGKLQATAPTGLRRVQSLMRTPAAGRSGTRSLSLGPPDVAVPLTLTIVPGIARFGNPGRLLFIQCPARAIDERLRHMADRFELTPVELKLCRGLLQGENLRRAGDLAGLTYETARWYLKQVFAKTHTHRQADLVRVLLGSSGEVIPRSLSQAASAPPAF